MALPTSGSLSIKATAGATRSICGEVGGTSGSLVSLASTASKSLPVSMLDFYGYSAGVEVTWCYPDVSGSVTLDCAEYCTESVGWTEISETYIGSAGIDEATGYRITGTGGSMGGTGTICAFEYGGSIPLCSVGNGAGPSTQFVVTMTGVDNDANYCFVSQLS